MKHCNLLFFFLFVFFCYILICVHILISSEGGVESARRRMSGFGFHTVHQCYAYGKPVTLKKKQHTKPKQHTILKIIMITGGSWYIINYDDIIYTVYFIMEKMKAFLMLIDSHNMTSQSVL